jgi:hypothetical protein
MIYETMIYSWVEIAYLELFRSNPKKNYLGFLVFTMVPV